MIRIMWLLAVAALGFCVSFQFAKWHHPEAYWFWHDVLGAKIDGENK